ncbi:MAG: protein phosphatase 2C domain-containing protein [Akkermansia sp.]|nr:protein phosphatase 2C domain-containing protein [Akkermansia sp.]
METTTYFFPTFSVAAAATQWQNTLQQEGHIYLHPQVEDSSLNAFLALLSDGAPVAPLLVESYKNAYTGKRNGNIVEAMEDANKTLATQKADGGAPDSAEATLIAFTATAAGIRWISAGDSLIIRQHGNNIEIINNRDDAAGKRICGTTPPIADLSPSTPAIIGERYIIATASTLPLFKGDVEQLLKSSAFRNATPEQALQSLQQKLCAVTQHSSTGVSVIIIDILPPAVTATGCTAISLLGDRETQQDAMGCWESDHAMLAVVADGAGGHVGGARAAQTAIHCMAETWKKQLIAGVEPQEAQSILTTAIQQAHKTIIAEAGGKAALSGKAAIVVLYCCNGHYTAVNVGDCRAYIHNAKSWKLLTKDDSLLRILVDHGEISPEEARNHPDQCILTQALGAASDLKPHVFSSNYTPDSTFLLCCDGFWNQLPEKLWDAEDWNAQSPGQHRTVLTDMAFAALREANGSSDNITAIRIHATGEESSGMWLRILAAMLISICVALAAFAILLFNDPAPESPVPATPRQYITESTEPQNPEDKPSTVSPQLTTPPEEPETMDRLNRQPPPLRPLPVKLQEDLSSSLQSVNKGTTVSPTQIPLQ